MQTARLRLDALHPDDRNARLHTERNREAIRASLVRFGQVEPLVVQAGTNRVIGGNGRLEVMRELEWEECDVVLLEADDDAAQAIAIALNRTSDLASWDFETLAAIIADVQEGDAAELADIGFTDADLANLAAHEWAPADPEVTDPPEPADGFNDGGGGGRDETHRLEFTPEQFERLEQAWAASVTPTASLEEFVLGLL